MTYYEMIQTCLRKKVHLRAELLKHLENNPEIFEFYDYLIIDTPPYNIGLLKELFNISDFILWGRNLVNNLFLLFILRLN